MGGVKPAISFYLANRPPLPEFRQLQAVRPLLAGEIAHIVAHSSNHWRKVFNVLAKFVFELPLAGVQGHFSSWQAYRDQALLQADGHEQLLFSAPDWQSSPGGLAGGVQDSRVQESRVHIVMGKTYAATLALPQLVWLDEYFAVNRERGVIVCPYPDYRQLSNARIGQLLELVTPMLPGDITDE
ncbi:hypothetical protein GSF27_04515 [Pseudomaricurvus sp. HS19]|nr:hypothetical protein [Pseudomaricurvus sp. HS19]MYM62614.1 hypothetical protein [Pseudomaricurvus sp. HS19]